MNGNKTKNFFKQVLKQKYLFLMSVPFIIYLIIFSYVPLFGWSYAFVDLKVGKSVFDCEFVGFKFFIQLLTDDQFLNAFKNTVIMQFLTIIFSNFLCPVFFALILNEVRAKTFKKTIQTVSYLPHFVSWVVVASIVMQFLTMNGGILYEVFVFLHMVPEGTNIMGVPKYFYTIFTVAEVWKEIGWNAIIYISAITGIDYALYEAAAVDGAGRIRRMWNVTLPGIRNTIIILLVMNIGNLVRGGYEAQMLLGNSMTMEKAEVVGLYILNYGIGLLRFSAGTAAGIITSILSLTLVLIANAISRKISEQSLF